MKADYFRYLCEVKYEEEENEGEFVYVQINVIL